MTSQSQPHKDTLGEKIMPWIFYTVIVVGIISLFYIVTIAFIGG